MFVDIYLLLVQATLDNTRFLSGNLIHVYLVIDISGSCQLKRKNCIINFQCDKVSTFGRKFSLTMFTFCALAALRVLQISMFPLFILRLFFCSTTG